MKLYIKNFGPIKEVEFNIQKSFIGIFGKNNSGKSYSISVIYLLIKHINNLDNDLEHIIAKLRKKNGIYRSLKNDYQKKNNNTKILMEQFFKDVFSEILTEKLTNSFFATFNDLNNLKNKSSKEQPEIILKTNHLELFFIVEETIVLNQITIIDKIVLRKIKTNRNVKIDKEKKETVLYVSSSNTLTLKNNIVEYTIQMIQSIKSDVKKYAKYVYYLPASRSGLYQGLSTFSQIFAELSQKRNLFNKKIEIPNIPEPISDYFLNLSTIRAKASPVGGLSSIVNEIENKLLKGKVYFDDTNNNIYYIPNDLNLKLDLSLTSSMISEISPVVSFLKYILPKNRKQYYDKKKKPKALYNSLLIIEEPEAHLHPEVQIQLMETFSKLIKIGVKIIITSHSNYMFNKMNNLVLEKKLNPEKIEVFVFDEFNDGIVTTAKIDELGIDDNNFVDVAENLYVEKIQAIEKINGLK